MCVNCNSRLFKPAACACSSAPLLGRTALLWRLTACSACRQTLISILSAGGDEPHFDRGIHWVIVISFPVIPKLCAHCSSSGTFVFAYCRPDLVFCPCASHWLPPYAPFHWLPDARRAFTVVSGGLKVIPRPRRLSLLARYWKRPLPVSSSCTGIIHLLDLSYVPVQRCPAGPTGSGLQTDR